MTKSIQTAMILAAGIGSRLRPLTDDTPKPLINIASKPVILRTLNFLAASGIKRVVINTHYLATMVETTVKANTPPRFAGFFQLRSGVVGNRWRIKKSIAAAR